MLADKRIIGKIIAKEATITNNRIETIEMMIITKTTRTFKSKVPKITNKDMSRKNKYQVHMILPKKRKLIKYLINMLTLQQYMRILIY